LSLLHILLLHVLLGLLELIKFLLQAWIGLHIHLALGQYVQRVIEILFSGVQASSLEVH